MAAIADAPPGAVLVHCSAGKDRTGMIVALALKTAGVPDEAIAADYAYTQECLRARLDALLAAAADSAERERILAWKSAVAPTIRTMLDHIEQHFGGVEAYLRGYGMSNDQIERLRTRLLPLATSVDAALATEARPLQSIGQPVWRGGHEPGIMSGREY